MPLSDRAVLPVPEIESTRRLTGAPAHRPSQGTRCEWAWFQMRPEFAVEQPMWAIRHCCSENLSLSPSCRNRGDADFRLVYRTVSKRVLCGTSLRIPTRQAGETTLLTKDRFARPDPQKGVSNHTGVGGAGFLNP